MCYFYCKFKEGIEPVPEGDSLTPSQLRHLLPVYRVGMLAMETLAKRVHDDRPQTKYSRNPPYGEDVKWLLSISMKLGNELCVTNMRKTLLCCVFALLL